MKSSAYCRRFEDDSKRRVSRGQEKAEKATSSTEARAFNEESIFDMTNCNRHDDGQDKIDAVHNRNTSSCQGPSTMSRVHRSKRVRRKNGINDGEEKLG